MSERVTEVEYLAQTALAFVDLDDVALGRNCFYDDLVDEIGG